EGVDFAGAIGPDRRGQREVGVGEEVEAVGGVDSVLSAVDGDTIKVGPTEDEVGVRTNPATAVDNELSGRGRSRGDGGGEVADLLALAPEVGAGGGFGVHDGVRESVADVCEGSLLVFDQDAVAVLVDVSEAGHAVLAGDGETVIDTDGGAVVGGGGDGGSPVDA